MNSNQDYVSETPFVSIPLIMVYLLYFEYTGLSCIRADIFSPRFCLG